MPIAFAACEFSLEIRHAPLETPRVLSARATHEHIEPQRMGKDLQCELKRAGPEQSRRARLSVHNSRLSQTAPPASAPGSVVKAYGGGRAGRSGCLERLVRPTRVAHP